ncbi:MAG: hypothetical protein IJX39_08095 [Clostridia bacterium]|nr:hypothetical protein [Clostridia bacterium]
MKYAVIKTTYQNELLTRTGYGIAAVQEYDGVTVVTESVADLSGDERAVTELVERCNRCDLSPEHLGDVVQDFLAGVAN